MTIQLKPGQENRKPNDAKIRAGIEELERGEGIPEDELAPISRV